MVKMGIVAKFFVNSRLFVFFHKWFGAGRLLKLVLPSATAKSILELGCGVGITTFFIASKFPEAEITALDYDPLQIKSAISRNAGKLKNVKFAVGDAENLGFKDGSFDAVFEVFAFHHINNYRKAVSEAYRLLKRNGKFTVMDVALKSLPFHRLIAFFEPEHFTKKEFVDALRKAGFVVHWSKGNLLFSLEAVKP